MVRIRSTDKTRKWHIWVGGLTATLATQGATAPQGPLAGDEEGELTVFVRVDELCVLADVGEDEGVLLGDAGVELVPDEGVDETVGTDAPLPDSALLMDAA
jgi:hypothetical protein